MNSDPIPPAILELFAGLEDSPNEAVQRFAGLSRWGRHKRARMTPERMREELGRAYREEVARVLGEWAGLNLFEDPGCRDLFHRSVRIGEALVQPTHSEWEEDADGILSTSHSKQLAFAEEVAAVERLRAGESVDRLQVVLLSWRLCAMDRLALHAAIEYRLLGEWTSSARFLDIIRNQPSSCLTLSYAWESEGALHMAQGQLDQASNAWRCASLCGEDRPAPATSWLMASLCLGDRSSAEDAANLLDELQPSVSEVVTVAHCFRSMRDRRVTNAEVDRESLSWANERGELARRIVDVFSS